MRKLFDLATDCMAENKNIGQVATRVTNGKMGAIRSDFSVLDDSVENLSVGNYVLLENLTNAEDKERFDYFAQLIKNSLNDLIKGGLPQNSNVLVVGLGNEQLVIDELGNVAVDKIIVTRHLLKELKREVNKSIASVCTLSPKVSGITGINSIEIIESVISNLKPDLVILIDALSSKEADKIFSCVQINDVGITPASAMKRRGEKLTKKTLGTKVIAIGVPVVCAKENGLVLTDQAVDMKSKLFAKLIAYGINMALFPFLTAEDVENCVH